MKDMLLLLTGDIILINEATYGGLGQGGKKPGLQPGFLPTLRRSDRGIHGAQPEPNSHNVPLHISALARWQSVSGREQPVPNVQLHSRSLPNVTQLRSILLTSTEPTVHSPESEVLTRSLSFQLSIKLGASRDKYLDSKYRDAIGQSLRGEGEMFKLVDNETVEECDKELLLRDTHPTTSTEYRLALQNGDKCI